MGTGFTIDVDGRQYLVTAKHVVEGFGSTNQLEVFGNGVWTCIAADLVARGEVDVTVFAPEKTMSPPNLPVVASSDGMAYGQDVYFLGFPYGVLSPVIFGDSGYPLPLVKKAILSSMAGDVFLLDGHNNPGFSGGPVLFGQSGGLPKNIAGVVSGYRYSQEPVRSDEADTTLTYKYNTGIMITYKIETALKMIHANPIGPLI